MPSTNQPTTEPSQRSHRYSLLIQWSDEHQRYTASCPELPDCESHAETRDGAMQEAVASIESAIDHAESQRKSLPGPWVVEDDSEEPREYGDEDLTIHRTTTTEILDDAHGEGFAEFLDLAVEAWDASQGSGSDAKEHIKEALGRLGMDEISAAEREAMDLSYAEITAKNKEVDLRYPALSTAINLSHLVDHILWKLRNNGLYDPELDSLFRSVISDIKSLEYLRTKPGLAITEWTSRCALDSQSATLK